MALDVCLFVKRIYKATKENDQDRGPTQEKSYVRQYFERQIQLDTVVHGAEVALHREARRTEISGQVTTMLHYEPPDVVEAT